MRYLDNDLYFADVVKTIEQTGNVEYFTGKSILILGASGLIGSFLTDCLLYANRVQKMNLHIYAASRSRERLIERFGEERKSLRFVEGDVTTLEFNMPIDVIVHSSSYAHPRAFREKPVETMLANMLGTYRVLEIARRNPGCRVLYVSSGEVQEEVDHLTTRACYPVSKKAGETLCLSYMQEYNVEVMIARPCHTFGAHAMEEDNRITAQFIARAADDQDIIMNSAGSQMRSFAYVADCVSGLLTILTCGQAGKVYGVASDEVCSIRQFAEWCAGTVQRQVVFHEANGKELAEASPIKEQIIDNTELKLLGWIPGYSIEQGIKHSVNIRKCIGRVD